MKVRRIEFIGRISGNALVTWVTEWDRHSENAVRHTKQAHLEGWYVQHTILFLETIPPQNLISVSHVGDDINIYYRSEE